MIVLAAVAALTLAPGLPVALLVAGARSRGAIRPSALLYDAVALGLSVHLIAGLVLMRVGLFSSAGILGTAAALTLAASIPLALRRELLPRVAIPSATPMAVVGAALIIVALFLRRNPIEFVFMIGDMGEYVNDAHRVAGGAELTESFPHLFSIFLALPATLFNWTNTVDALPLTGLLVLGGVLRLGGLLEVHAVPRSAVGLAVAVGVVPVWFSIFPASEALYASLVLLLLVTLVRAHREDASGLAVLAGAMTLSLGLTRGNTLLLLPVLGLYLVVCMVLPARRDLDLRFVIVGLGGILVSFAYNVAFLPVYYVGRQLMRFVPDRPVLAGLEIGLLRPGWLLALTAGVVLAVVFTFERLAGPTARGLRPRTRSFLASAAPLVVLVAAAVWVVARGHDGVVGGLSRQGVIFTVAGGFGLASGAILSEELETRRLVVLGALLASIFGALHGLRVPVDRPHSYFLYLDRYLFSEVFVAFVVGALVGLGILWRGLRFRVPGPLLVVVAALLLAVPFQTLGETLHATERRLFGDAYGLMEDLDSLTPADGVPLVFDGMESTPSGWVYPNTYRTFAVPLQSVGHEFLNLPPAGQPFSPDPSPSYREVGELMQRQSLDRVYLMRVVDPDEPASDPPPLGLGVERLGVVDHTFDILNQNPGSIEGWHTVNFEVEALEVRRTGPTGVGRRRSTSRPRTHRPRPTGR